MGPMVLFRVYGIALNIMENIRLAKKFVQLVNTLFNKILVKMKNASFIFT